jgi:hypothetical protein
VTALVKHLSNEAAKKKNQLLEEDEMFHLVWLHLPAISTQGMSFRWLYGRAGLMPYHTQCAARVYRPHGAFLCLCQQSCNGLLGTAPYKRIA